LTLQQFKVIEGDDGDGDMFSFSIDFGVPLTGIDSVGCPSVSE